MNKITRTIAATATIAIAASTIVLTTATPAFANANGNCSPANHAVHTTSQAVKGWKDNGVTKQVGNGPLRKAGYRAINGSVPNFMSERVIIASLAQAAHGVDNYGCRSEKLFGAGKETHAVGHKVGVVLPNKYDKSNASGTAKKGWQKIDIETEMVFDTGCANPNTKRVHVWIWVRPTPKPKTCQKGYTGHYPHCTKPKPAPKPTCKPGQTGTYPKCYTPKPPVSKPSFSCTGLSAVSTSGQYGLNYTFAVSAQVSNTSTTGSKYTVLSNGDVIATPSSNTLSTQYSFSQAGSYTVQGQVITTAGTTPISPTCTTTVTIGTPPAPPVTHTTSVSCTKQEEITSGDASYFTCDLVADVSAANTLSYTIEDPTELDVSGVTCTDNNEPSCDSSPGHYQLTLEGTNNTSSQITTYLDISGTANGITSQVTRYAIKIDPADISFNSRSGNARME